MEVLTPGILRIWSFTQLLHLLVEVIHLPEGEQRLRAGQTQTDRPGLVLCLLPTRLIQRPQGGFRFPETLQQQLADKDHRVLSDGSARRRLLLKVLAETHRAVVVLHRRGSQILRQLQAQRLVFRPNHQFIRTL